MLRQGQKLVSGFTVKFFPDERERIKAAAEKMHLATIPWIRKLVLDAVKKVEEDE